MNLWKNEENPQGMTILRNVREGISFYGKLGMMCFDRLHARSHGLFVEFLLVLSNVSCFER